jgi:hypothetical protein
VAFNFLSVHLTIVILIINDNIVRVGPGLTLLPGCNGAVFWYGSLDYNKMTKLYNWKQMDALICLICN